MLIKGIKPCTQLAIDALLFGLLAMVTLSALMEHTVARNAAHMRFMWHVLHGIAGTTMCLTLGVHLLMHLPWIRSQLSRLFSSRAGLITRTPQ